MMSPKALLIVTFFFLLLCSISILFIDQPLVVLIDSFARVLQPFVTQLTLYTDTVTGYTYSKYLLPGVVALAGIAVWVYDKSKRRAKYFIFVAITAASSAYITSPLKNLFSRARPAHILETGGYGTTFWIDGGDSFPSGHVARYFGIFLPLCLIFPKFRMALLVVPLYISLGRMILGVHFLSDVLASLYIVILLMWSFSKVLSVGSLTLVGSDSLGTRLPAEG